MRYIQIYMSNQYSKTCCSNKIRHASAGEYKEGHFGSMGAKQAADERREMRQLCESYACEHEEETETAEEDKQTFYIRVMDKMQA